MKRLNRSNRNKYRITASFPCKGLIVTWWLCCYASAVRCSPWCLWFANQSVNQQLSMQINANCAVECSLGRASGVTYEFVWTGFFQFPFVRFVILLIYTVFLDEVRVAIANDF